MWADLEWFIDENHRHHQNQDYDDDDDYDDNNDDDYGNDDDKSAVRGVATGPGAATLAKSSEAQPIKLHCNAHNYDDEHDVNGNDNDNDYNDN